MKKLRAFETLRFKLVITAVVLILIPFTVVFTIYNNTVKDIISSKYTDSAVQSVYETGEKIEIILEDIKEFSTVIISDGSFLNLLKNPSDYSRQDFDNQLRSYLRVRDEIEAIELITNGTYYSMGANKVEKGDASYQKLADSDGEPIWMPTKIHRIDILSSRFNKTYFTLGRKIIDYNTLDDYGYLLLNLDELILDKAYRNLVDYEGVDLIISNETGKIMSHSNKAEIGKSIVFEPYANVVLSDENGYNTVRYEDANGIEKVAIYSTINNNGWKIIKTISTTFLYEEMTRIQEYLMWGGILYGLGVISYLIFFSYKVTEPMLRMKKVMRLVEKGNLNVRTEAKSNDEVGQLGKGFNQMIFEIQNLMDRLVIEEQSKKELELEALHAQINPHFLYNTLNTIKWMAKLQGNVSVDKAITALIKLLRTSIDLSQDMMTLRDEVDYVKNYLVIQRLRFNESINIAYNIDESLLDVVVPKLILQPIVENSIIYTFEDEREVLNITINGYKTDDYVVVEVIDDGPGIENSIFENIFDVKRSRNRFSKVGLQNVNERIKLYFGDAYGLKIHTAIGEGTKVTVLLKYD